MTKRIKNEENWNEKWETETKTKENWNETETNKYKAIKNEM